jgi:hypothetical protein
MAYMLFTVLPCLKGKAHGRLLDVLRLHYGRVLVVLTYSNWELFAQCLNDVRSKCATNLERRRRRVITSN